MSKAGLVVVTAVGDMTVPVDRFKSTFYDCDTLPSQVPVQKMEHESTARKNVVVRQ